MPPGSFGKYSVISVMQRRIEPFVRHMIFCPPGPAIQYTWSCFGIPRSGFGSTMRSGYYFLAIRMPTNSQPVQMNAKPHQCNVIMRPLFRKILQLTFIDYSLMYLHLPVD